MFTSCQIHGTIYILIYFITHIQTAIFYIKVCHLCAQIGGGVMPGGALTRNQYYALKIVKAVTLPMRKVNEISYKLRHKRRNFDSCRYKKGISPKQLMQCAVLLTGIVLVAAPTIRDLARDINVPTSAAELQKHYSSEKGHLPNLPGRGNNSFTAPFWENEKASDRALADELNVFKKDKKTFEQARFDIAFENVQELTEKLAEYENKFQTVADYQNLNQNEKLKFASIYIGREIEVRQLIIYGQDPDITIENRQRAAKESAKLQSQWYHGAMVNLLNGVDTILSAMPPSYGGFAEPTVGKLAAFGGTKLGAILLNVFGEQVSAQIARQAESKVESQIAVQVEHKLLSEIDKNVAKGIGETISNDTKDVVVANIGGITLREGNWGQGLNHILVRHYTEEYITTGTTTLFPKTMKPSEIVEIIKESIQYGTAEVKGKRALIKAVFKNERDGVKEVVTVIGDVTVDSKGKIIRGKVITSYPVKGSGIRKNYK